MFKEITLILCGYFILCCDSRTAESLKVQLPDGSKLLGRYLTSDSGRGIRAFMGVPYAEKPIGKLRWKVSEVLNEKKLPFFLEVTSCDRLLYNL